MLKILLAGGLVAGLLGTGVVDPPSNDRILIDVVTVNGSGCPAGSAAVRVSMENTNVSITYANFMAQIGIGAQPTDLRKNCQLSLVVHVPAGQTYALGPVAHSGFASLAAGANAVLRTNTYFQGQSPTAFHSFPFAGPLSDDVVVAEPVDPDTAIFAPCGALRNANINIELRVNAGTSDTKKTTSFLALDESVTLPLILRPCAST